MSTAGFVRNSSWDGATAGFPIGGVRCLVGRRTVRDRIAIVEPRHARVVACRRAQVPALLDRDPPDGRVRDAPAPESRRPARRTRSLRPRWRRTCRSPRCVRVVHGKQAVNDATATNIPARCEEIRSLDRFLPCDGRASRAGSPVPRTHGRQQAGLLIARSAIMEANAAVAEQAPESNGPPRSSWRSTNRRAHRLPWKRC